MTTAKTLADAFISAQKAMKDPALSGSNPHFKSKFVPRDSVLHAVKPALNAEGVAMAQSPEPEGVMLRLYGHGEVWEFGPFPVMPQSDPQKQLAAYTYASRGQLMQVFCLAGDEDADGNDLDDPRRRLASAATDAPTLATAKQLDTIRSLSQQLGLNDDTYAAALDQLGGVTADTDLSQTAAQAIITRWLAKVKS